METALEASRSPVYVRLEHPVEWHLRRHLKFSILWTDGVALLASGQEPTDEHVPVPSSLTDDQLLVVLEGLPVRPDGDGSRHDLANRWGPVRLWRGLQVLRPSDEVVPNPGWVGRVERELRAEEPYAYLLALADLRGVTEPTPAAGSSWADWRQFARGVSGGPLKVLLLDDEIERGWGDAVSAALSVPGKVVVDTSLSGVDFDAARERVEGTALGERWDLVLADLRTSAADRAGGPARGAGQYGGAEWVRQIKSARPDTAVVAFTASDKAWSVQELRDLGVDGYWTKESPEFGVNDAYSAAHAAALLDAVGPVLYKRVRARPVWDLWEALDAVSRQADYVGAWARETGRAPGETRADDRIAAVLDRIRRAYGFLVLNRSSHAESAFALRALDLAFLSLWGCLNEVVSLYFSDPPYQRHLDRARDAAFVRRSPLTRSLDVYWHVVKGREATPSTVPSTWKEDLTPGAGTAELAWPKRRKDTARVAWLLDEVGPPGLAARFDHKSHRKRAGLRELRNNLEEAHGDVETRAEATLDDVHALCDVWRSLLVTPYV